jgi:protocatechuate 3,4-dioxygenase beta subunit
MTDQDGRYRFNGLDPGPYRLTAEKVGFAPVDR